MEFNPNSVGGGKHEAEKCLEMESNKRAKLELGAQEQPKDEICKKQELEKDQEMKNLEIQDSQAFATEDSQPLENYADSNISLGMI